MTMALFCTACEVLSKAFWSPDDKKFCTAVFSVSLSVPISLVISPLAECVSTIELVSA